MTRDQFLASPGGCNSCPVECKRSLEKALMQRNAIKDQCPGDTVVIRITRYNKEFACGPCDIRQDLESFYDREATGQFVGK